VTGIHVYIYKLNSVACSPQANYIDRATAALLAKLVPPFCG
jgi:hypothetical protein